MFGAAEGECMTWAYDNLPDASNAKLVHAKVHPHGGKWGDPPQYHAWIERVGRVYDWQSVVKGLGPGERGWPKKFFYEVYQPVEIVKYDYATTRKRPWLRTAPVACLYDP